MSKVQASQASATDLTERNVVDVVTADSQTFLCFTLRDVRAGEQLLVPYGLGTVESGVGTAAARVAEAAEQGEMRLSELLKDCELLPKTAMPCTLDLLVR